MNLKRALPLLLCCAASLGAVAEVPESFAKFRQGALERFEKFRSEILENYSKFLAGEWVEIKLQERIPAFSVPKPEEMPVMDEAQEDLPAVDIATPLIISTKQTDHFAQIVNNHTTPDFVKHVLKSNPVLRSELSVGAVIVGTPEIKLLPAVPEASVEEQVVAEMTPNEVAQEEEVAEVAPSVPSLGLLAQMKQHEEAAPNDVDMSTFDFYGIPMSIPKVDISILRAVPDKDDVVRQWNHLNDNKIAASVLPYLNEIASQCRLNDYLTMQLISKYVDSRFPDTDRSSRLSLCHYLLSHMGYDVRLGRTTGGKVVLLVPYDEEVIYDRRGLEINSRNYYIFDGTDSDNDFEGESISTCLIPGHVDCGKKLSLRFAEGLNLPYKPVPFNVTYGGLTLTGELNGNLFPLIYRYPQMPITGFATSTLLPELRQDLVRQVKEQLAGLSNRDAVNKLLHFTQKGFEYETDGKFHGFEKPYFLEEMLYYPKCDCEDRAIFYTWLLWNALGVENHLLYYPGHEAAAVHIDDEIRGASYTFEGQRFYISDPTYLGSSTGQCMDNYREQTPEIEFQYK